MQNDVAYDIGKLLRPLVLLFAVFVAAAAPVGAQRQPPVVGVGVALKSYSEIKAMTDARIGGRLIGSDFDPDTFTYQMRYMRGTGIIDVLVDARTGKILGGRESM